MAHALLPSLRGYSRSWLRSDVVAGLTVWAVLVPEAFAYATIAGVSPVVGLYAAPPALLLYAVFGSSRHLVTGPMSATAALSATAVAELAVRERDVAATTAAIAIVVGIIAVLAGLLRLGFISNFISEPVLKGFIIGMALTIIIGQVPKLIGVEGGSGSFFPKLRSLLADLDETSAVTLGVGVVSLVLVLALKRVAPRLPGSLVVVAGAVGVSALFDLDDHGVAIVGATGSGLPPVGVPDVGLSDYVDLIGPALGIMFVGFAEGLGAARSYAAKAHYDIDPDQELRGLGAANLGAGLFSGMVVNGSLSKTAVNGAAGAKSQVSGLVAAALTAVTLFITGVFEPLPEATLAAVVIAAVIELVDLRALARFARARSAHLDRIYGPAARSDLIAAVAALVGVLVFDTLPGLFIGVGVALLLLVDRSSRPNVAVLGRIEGTTRFADLDREEDGQRVSGVVIVRPESAMYFANAEAIRGRVLELVEAEAPSAVVIDAETVPSIDLTSVEMLERMADDLRRRGIRLAVARDIGQVRDLLDEAARTVAFDSFATVGEAVDAVGPSSER